MLPFELHGRPVFFSFVEEGLEALVFGIPFSERDGSEDFEVVCDGGYCEGEC